MREEVIWGTVIFASFISAGLFRIPEEIVVLCLMLFLILLGCKETLAHVYDEVRSHTLIPSKMVMGGKLLEEIQPS